MRRSMLRAVFVVGVLVVVALSAPAQSPIGSIDESYGYVEIDAFGAGRFVEIEIPEAIYENSLVRTDYESWAYLTIDGKEFTVGPNSTTPVSTFVTERRRGRGEGFFARVLRELTRSLLPPEDDEIVAGGRASQVEGDTTAWVFDIDPNELFEEAQLQIDAGRYESAVESLRLIEFPEDGDFEIEEYFVNLSYSLMGMGDFHAGMVESFEYALSDPAPENVGRLTPRLQLLGGIAAYYSGEDEISEAAIDAYLDEIEMANVAAEAVVIKHALLLESGRRSGAAALLREAERAQPDVDWSGLTSR